MQTCLGSTLGLFFFFLHSVFYQRKLNDVTAICHHYHQCSHWSFWLSWSSDCIIWQGGLDRRAGCWLVRVWSVLLPWNCCSDDSDGRLKPLSSLTVFFLGIMLVSLEPSWLYYFSWYLFFSSTIIFLCFRFIISPFRIYSKWSCFPFFFLPPCLHPKRHFPAFLFPTFIMKLAHVQKNWKNGTVNNTHMLYTLIPTYTFFFAMLFKTKWWCVTSQYTLWPASREKGHFLYQHNTIMTPKKTSQSIFRFLHLSQ